MKYYVKQKAILTLEVPMTELTIYLRYLEQHPKSNVSEICVRSITTEG